MTTQREIVGWQYECQPHLHCEPPCWSAVASRGLAVFEATRATGATGRIRPVYAGDAIDARKPVDPEDERVPFP